MPLPLAAHIRAFYSLSSTPLSYDVVRARCSDLGWSIDDEDVRHCVLRVHFDRAVSVFVASLGPGQRFGRTIYLPLFYTEDTYDCMTGFPPGTKPDFDAAYDLAQSLFEEAIGTPGHTGTFEYFHGTYRFCVWRGAHAVLALIQDDFDVLFGSEITAWIIECAADDPLPSLPPHA
jgi:hypothetical protein